MVTLLLAEVCIKLPKPRANNCEDSEQWKPCCRSEFLLRPQNIDYTPYSSLLAVNARSALTNLFLHAVQSGLTQ